MQYKSFMEALKGKQHKIDKNKNGKIDAHDFKLLRKEESEQLEEATVKTQKYSWGTMKTVHHGADFSIPLHPEHHQAIAKLKDEQEHKFKTEDGKHWTARRKGDEVHFQGANNGGSTKVKHADLKEEVEIEEGRVKELAYDLDTMSHDEFHKTYGKPKSNYQSLKGNQHKIDKNKNGKIDSHDFKLLRKEESEQLEEGLDPSEVAGNPRMYSADTVKKAFYHKKVSASDKESLARHLDRHHGNKEWRKQVKEEVEQVDENSGPFSSSDYMPGKRIGGANLSSTSKKDTYVKTFTANREKEATEFAKKHGYIVKKRTYPAGHTNLHPHEYQVHKEEVEQVDEIDMSKTLAAYNKDKPHYAQAKIDTRTSAERRAETDKKLAAQKKPVVQPAQPVKSKPVTSDDIHKQIAKSYANHKPGQYVGDSYELNGEVMSEESLDEKLNPSMGAGEYIKDFQKSDAPQFAGKSKEKRRVMGIAAYLSAKRKANEEVDLEENAPVAPVPDKKYIKGTPEHKAYKATKQPRVGHPTNVKEEAELEESSAHKKIATFFKNREIAQRAFKALTGGSDEDQLKALQKRTGVPVTGKKPVKEEIEELAEKSEQARKNKIMKNVMDASKGAKYNRDSGLKLTPGDTGHSTAQQMNKALGRHLRREDIEEAAPVSVKVNHALEAPHEEQWEDTGICPEHNKKDCHECGKAAMKEDTGQKSYKEFMMMLEYESDKSGSYKHTGTYGSEYAKKEREKDEKGFDSENEPAKRGPKMGSKRGPKANLGSSKLHTK